MQPISMEFDLKGYLLPHECLVQTDLNSFKRYFVESISTEKRNLIYSNFLSFLHSIFEKLEVLKVRVWINGSFTNIRANPNDIDFVLFISPDVSDKHKLILKTDFNKDKLRKEYFLDPFYIYESNEGHSDETTTNLDRAYWINQFTRTRPDRRGRIFKKGLIEITIHKHETE